MVEVKNLIKLWIEESCPSTGSLPEQESSLTVSKGGYSNWFNTPWLWMLLSLWYGILFFPCFAFGDQNKIQILLISLGNGRYISKQGTSCWAWAGDFRPTFCEIRAWVLNLDFKAPDFLHEVRICLPSKHLLVLPTEHPPVSLTLNKQWEWGCSMVYYLPVLPLDLGWGDQSVRGKNPTNTSALP